jgi:hypothetical protein
MSEVIHSHVALNSFSDLSLDLGKGKEDVTSYVEEVHSNAKFLEIPREIRDHIYSLMFLSDEPIYPSKDRSSISEYLGILRTNHQIYCEAVEVLYGRNTFQIRGSPARAAPEFLNLLTSQRREGYLHPSYWTVDTSKVCLARHFLKRLYFPSYNMRLDRLKHLFSLLNHFPNLEYLRVVYEKFGLTDMDVVSVCRLLRDRKPHLRNFLLYKRISYSEAEDISWMIWERPYRTWSKDLSSSSRRTWKNQDGVLREAAVVSAPQITPE